MPCCWVHFDRTHALGVELIKGRHDWLLDPLRLLDVGLLLGEELSDGSLSSDVPVESLHSLGILLTQAVRGHSNGSIDAGAELLASDLLRSSKLLGGSAVTIRCA
jgi:hypothetical protein